MYIYTQKIGRKLFGLASWTCGAGLYSAAAEDVFRAHGLDGGSARWANVQGQKNWGGFVDGALVLTDTEAEARAHRERRAAREYRRMGLDWERFASSQEPRIVTKEQYEAITPD